MAERLGVGEGSSAVAGSPPSWSQDCRPGTEFARSIVDRDGQGKIWKNYKHRREWKKAKM